MATPTTGVIAVTNVNPLSGGAFQETDNELRDRWKKTVFRSMAGTESMFLGIAVNDADCTGANVVGATKRRREQVQVVSGVAQSTAADVFYTYASGQMVGRDIDNGDMARPRRALHLGHRLQPASRGHHRHRRIPGWHTARPGLRLRAEGLAQRPGEQHHQPGRRVVRRARGSSTRARRASSGTPSGSRPPAPACITTRTTSGRTARLPTVGNIFVPLAWGPIVSVPSQIVIGATTYGLADATHAFGSVSGGVTYAYQIVHENTAFGWSPISRFGLEWYASNQPAANSVFSVDAGYTYNDVPSAVQMEINRWRLAGIDAQAHQAKSIFLKFNLAIIYDFKVDQGVTGQAIDSAISDHLGKLGFDAVVQASDIIQVVHNVPGVDQVRFLHDTDVVGWNSATPNAFTVGIQRVVNGTVVQSYVDTSGRPKDVILGDDQVPALGATTKIAKAQNSWTP
jgi:hypothetical protein